jgi:DNA-directed RNA polymerase specialized sigma24 family protein
MSWLSVSDDDTRFVLVDALNAEWNCLNRDGCAAARSRARLSRWSGWYPVLAGCRYPDDVLEQIRRRPDEILTVLIALYQDGRPNPTRMSDHQPRLRSENAADGHNAADGELAGRIVVQTMLGKLVSMARRDPGCGIEEYVAAMWTRLGRYSLQRRPARVAANLALDTLKEVTRSRATVQLVPLGSDLDGLPAVEAAGDAAPVSAHQVLRNARELGLIDDPTRRLLSVVYAEGMSGRQAAAALGLTPTTLRYRCSRAVRRLAQHAQMLAAA